MGNDWPVVPLGNFLTERQDTPDLDDLITGEVSIISKIGFNTGNIKLRDDGKTRTQIQINQQKFELNVGEFKNPI